MSFFSWYFLLFLAGALLLYYGMPKKLRWLILLAVSLCFYYLGGWRGLLYLLFTAATTYGAGLLLDRLNARAKADKTRKVKGKKQLVLTLCLLLNFGLLYVVKYWNFTASAFGRLGVELPVSSLFSFREKFVPKGIECRKEDEQPKEEIAHTQDSFPSI